MSRLRMRFPKGIRVGFRVSDDDQVPKRRGGSGVAGGEQERGRHHVRADLKSTGKRTEGR